MSTALKQIFEQVHQLSHAEQRLLIAYIAQSLSEEESEPLPTGAITSSGFSPKPFIAKGDKSLDPTALFGIWASRPKNLQEIRQNAWERN